MRVEDEVEAMLSHLRALPLNPPVSLEPDMPEDRRGPRRAGRATATATVDAERDRLQHAARAARVGNCIGCLVSSRLITL